MNTLYSREYQGWWPSFAGWNPIGDRFPAQHVIGIEFLMDLDDSLPDVFCSNNISTSNGTNVTINRLFFGTDTYNYKQIKNAIDLAEKSILKLPRRMNGIMIRHGTKQMLKPAIEHLKECYKIKEFYQQQKHGWDLNKL